MALDLTLIPISAALRYPVPGLDVADRLNVERVVGTILDAFLYALADAMDDPDASHPRRLVDDPPRDALSHARDNMTTLALSLYTQGYLRAAADAGKASPAIPQRTEVAL